MWFLKLCIWWTWTQNLKETRFQHIVKCETEMIIKEARRRIVSINMYSLELHQPTFNWREGERPVAISFFDVFIMSHCQFRRLKITHQTPPMQTRHIKSKSNTFYVTEPFSLLVFSFGFFLCGKIYVCWSINLWHHTYTHENCW